MASILCLALSTGDMLEVLCRLRANSFAVKRPAASPASSASPVPSTSASTHGGHESAAVDASEYIRMWRDFSREVGRCRLTVSKPVLKAPMVSALQT